jgi:alkaline phosphatase D
MVRKLMSHGERLSCTHRSVRAFRKEASMRGLTMWLGVVATLLVVAGLAAADDSFPQSVASGDPTADSVVLWTRAVMPDGDPPETIDLVVATDQGMANVVVTRSIEVDPEYDGAVKVKVDGLMPYHDYY